MCGTQYPTLCNTIALNLTYAANLSNDSNYFGMYVQCIVMNYMRHVHVATSDCTMYVTLIKSV